LKPIRFSRPSSLFSLLLMGCLLIPLLAACTGGGQGRPVAPTPPVTSNVDPNGVSGNVTIKNPEDLGVDSITQIACNGAKAAISGGGAVIKDGNLIISQPGTYWISGTLKGSVFVSPDYKEDQAGNEAEARGEVELVLAGVTLSATEGPAIYIKKTSKATITLVDQTKNVLEDAVSYSRENLEEEMDAALLSKNDLVIRGTGSLEVTGHYQNGIKCKDILTIEGGSYKVNAVENAITGRDALVIGGGSFLISAGQDGLQATLADNSSLGYVVIYGGEFTVAAGDEAFQATTDLLIKSGSFNVAATGNAFSAGVNLLWENAVAHSVSAGNDALKAESGLLEIRSGTLSLTSENDGIDTVDLLISGGTVTLSSKQKNAVNAAGNVTVSGGELDLTVLGVTYKTSTSSSVGGWGSSSGSYETNSDGYYKLEQRGIEANGAITVSGGNIKLTTTGHAMVAGGDILITGSSTSLVIDAYYKNCNSKGISTSSNLVIEDGTVEILRSYEALEGYNVYIRGGNLHILSSDDGINATGEASSSSSVGKPGGGMPAGDNNVIEISGGSVYLDASGDGIDSNGDFLITGGSLVLSGPSDSANAPIDIGDGGCLFAYTGGTLIAAGSGGMAETPSVTEDGALPYIFLGAEIPSGTTVSVKDSAGNILLHFDNPKQANSIILGTEAFALGESYTITIGTTEFTVTLSSIATTVGATISGGFGPGGGMHGGGPATPPAPGGPGGKPH